MKSINENRFLRLEAYFGKEKVNKAFICYNFSILEDYL